MLTSAQATDALGKVQNAYSGVQSLKAGFTQESYLASLESSETSSGSVWFSKPGKMKWNYAEPEIQTFLVKDSTLWLYQKEENQVLIDEFRKVLISDLPVSFLMGLGNLKSDFSVISACQNTEGLVFNLVPSKSKDAGAKKGDEGLKGFRLLVNPNTNLPKGAMVTDVGGNVTAITLSALEANPKVNDSIFAADFPKSADINDRRVKGDSAKNKGAA
jgi:outer membrane lipoprotein carrier protein